MDLIGLHIANVKAKNKGIEWPGDTLWNNLSSGPTFDNGKALSPISGEDNGL